MTNFLRRRALANEGFATRTFVLCLDPAKPSAVSGYYCLAASSIDRHDLPGRYRRNMPDPVPIVLLGRLAVHRDHEGRGVGLRLLGDAMKRTLAASTKVGVRMLAVHPISLSAEHYYMQYGFEYVTADPLTLALPIENLADEL